MSMKIFNGVKLSGMESMTKVMEFVSEVRTGIRDEVHKHRAHEIKTMACVIYDMYHSVGEDIIDPEETTRVPLLLAVNRIMEVAQSNANGKEEYSLCFSTYKGTTYCIPYFFHQPILDVVFAHPKVTRFPYWDNSDKDETVTDAQWDKRKEVWNHILEISGVPAESMLTVKLMDAGLLIPDDDFMEDVPSVAERETQLGRILAFKRAESELTEEGVDYSNRISLLIERVEKVHEEVDSEIKGRLKPITMEDLGEEIPQPEQGEDIGKETISETSSTD